MHTRNIFKKEFIHFVLFVFYNLLFRDADLSVDASNYKQLVDVVMD